MGLPPLSSPEVASLREDMSALWGERCDVQRDNSQGQEDAYGQTPPPEWLPHLNGVPCAYWQASGTTNVSAGVEVVVESRSIGLPHGTDVRETDRIVNVRDQTGAVRETGPLRVDSVSIRATHVEVAVMEVSW